MKQIKKEFDNLLVECNKKQQNDQIESEMKEIYSASK